MMERQEVLRKEGSGGPLQIPSVVDCGLGGVPSGDLQYHSFWCFTLDNCFSVCNLISSLEILSQH